MNTTESVYACQKNADHFLLAIPLTDIFSYYDAQLLREFLAVSVDLLLN